MSAAPRDPLPPGASCVDDVRRALEGQIVSTWIELRGAEIRAARLRDDLADLQARLLSLVDGRGPDADISREPPPGPGAR